MDPLNQQDHYLGTYEADNGLINIAPSDEDGMFIVVQKHGGRLLAKEVEAHEVIVPIDTIDRMVNAPHVCRAEKLSEQLFGDELDGPLL